MNTIAENNQNSLIEYCHFAHDSSFRIEELINFDFEPFDPREAGSLKRSLDFLRARTKRAEVRILVLGPLKAGKSTLMNVLVGDPHISQISALPAYPCFVEVKDLERDAEGNPVEAARAIFYAPDNRVIKETTQQEGETYLNALLDEFMAQGDQAELKCERVEQRIAMPRSPDGLSLTLIDSPGLFFSRKVDNQFFNRNGWSLASDSAPPDGEGDYSGSTKRLYVEADVVIFAIRPEQLFFHVVSEWLRDFIRDELMRVFILVNASTHSKTQEGDRFTNYNQVERAEEIRGYFIKHVADDALKARIVEDTRLSLRFADLLDVATTMFAENQDAVPLTPTASDQVLAEIRRYISGENLAARKMESIKDLLQRTIAEGKSYLKITKSRKERKLADLASDCQEAQTTIESLERERAALRSKLAEAEQTSLAIKTRQHAVRQYLSSNRLPELSGDPEIEQFRKLHQITPAHLISINGDQKHREEQVEKLYRLWRAGQAGNRSLYNLAEAVWESAPVTGGKALRAQYAELLQTASSKFLQQAGSVSPSGSLQTALLEASREPGASRLLLPDVNPILLLNPLPLFQFDTRQKWKLWWAQSPEKLWGANGKSYVGKNGDEILQSEEKTFLSCIWKDWNLSQVFSADHLGATAKNAGLRQIAEAWLKVLEGLTTATQELIAQFQRQIRKTEEELANAQKHLAQIEYQLEEVAKQIGEIEKSAANLTELSELSYWHDPA